MSGAVYVFILFYLPCSFLTLLKFCTIARVNYRLSSAEQSREQSKMSVFVYPSGIHDSLFTCKKLILTLAVGKPNQLINTSNVIITHALLLQEYESVVCVLYAAWLFSGLHSTPPFFCLFPEVTLQARCVEAVRPAVCPVRRTPPTASAAKDLSSCTNTSV